ncbi:MAG TPA: hypothetical protein ENJ80_03095, partial [Gammaproteobacteria bacterium]|nr:hypothetical protein [Gammaproteobacteria bacterium]
PGRIEQLESEIETIHQRMSDPAFYQLPGEEVTALREQLDQTETALQGAYRRWEELEP